MVKPSQEDDFFARLYRGYFFRDSFSVSIYQNTSGSIRPSFQKKSDMSQQP